MKFRSPSPFTKPISGLRIKEGAPQISRPSKEDVLQFPNEAKELVDATSAVQESLLRARKYDLSWLKGSHVILAGATGQGLGGALAAAVLDQINSEGSLTLISRDLTRSIGYETGKYMEEKAKLKGIENRFYRNNNGLAIEGKSFEELLSKLKEFGAKEVIYINTIASASSGLLPDHPPVFVKDMDDEGLFQWQLTPLDKRSIEATKYFMGQLAVQFPTELENHGIHVAATGYADWRGSIDRCSRNPKLPEYGRHGPYSTSLFLPKEIIQKTTSIAYRSKKMVLDFFYPVMHTRSLAFIPGGSLMGKIFDELRFRSGLPFVDIPELALATFDRIGKSLWKGVDNPFPRLDMHEASLELWFYEVMTQLTNDENSDFFYKLWICEEC